MNAVTPVPSVITAPQVNTLAPIAISNELSIAPALKIAAALAPYRQVLENLKGQAERAVINSAESAQKATELMSIAQGNHKQLEALRKAVKGPVDDYGKFIQTLFVPLQTGYDTAYRQLGKKCGEWQAAEEKRRREAEEAARKAAEAEMLELAEQQAASGDTAGADAILDAATLAPPARSLAVPSVANSAGQKLSTTKRWVGDVGDLKVILQAVLDGKLPQTLITVGKAEMNVIARQVQVEGVHFGIKVSIDRSTGLR